MTDIDPTTSGAPPYLARIEIRAPELQRWGSGVLVHGGWILTVRHLFEGLEGIIGRPGWSRDSALRIRVGCGGEAVESADGILLDRHQDLALVPLARPLGAVPGRILDGGFTEKTHLQVLKLVPFGYPGTDPAGMAVRGDPLERTYSFWNAETGEHESLQFDGGALEGMSGGMLGVPSSGGWAVAALLHRGGAGYGRTHVFPSALLLRFLKAHPAVPFGTEAAQEPVTGHPAHSEKRLTPEAIRELLESSPAIRRQLVELLVALECWRYQRERDPFVDSALPGHPALDHLEREGQPRTVAKNLVQQLAYFDRAMLEHDLHPVCGILRQIRDDDYDANSRVAALATELARTFGCARD